MIQNTMNNRQNNKSTKKKPAEVTIDALVRKEVKQMLRQNEERKVQFNAYSDIRVIYPTLIATATLIDCTITMPQGTSFWNRIGTKVRVSKYIWRCACFCPVGQIVGPANLRLVFCKLRGAPNAIPTAGDYAQLKRTTNANGTQGIYTFSGISQLAPYNTDYWSILKTVDHKVGFASSVPANDNDYSLRVEFEVDMTSMIKSEVCFSDGVSATRQVNDGLFCYVMMLDAQEATPIASSVTPTINITTELRYTDA